MSRTEKLNIIIFKDVCFSYVPEKLLRCGGGKELKNEL
jgi:hypothetical protein